VKANLKGRSCLTLEEFSAGEITDLLDDALTVKAEKRARVFGQRLSHRNICLIFLKPSCRTRVAFAVAAADEGAHVEVLAKDDIRFGIKETVKDIARVLGRMFDGIAFRGFDHATVEELARHAGVPVWNALSDEHHPTQALADMMILREEFGRLDGLKLAYVGDGRNNVVTSLAVASLKLGVELSIVAPPELQPNGALHDRLERLRLNGPGRVTVTDDAARGLDGADAVYSDVWVSMGEEALLETRIAQLRHLKVTGELMALTGKRESIYLHCLPALHDLDTEFARTHPDAREVDDDVFEGPASRVFEQAENRMHTIKALMVATI
jgi:ornithine carbamoyltransferase